MSLFKISKSPNKASSASKSILSAQSTPRSSMSLDGPAHVQGKSTSSASGCFKTSSMAYAISRS